MMCAPVVPGGYVAGAIPDVGSEAVHVIEEFCTSPTPECYEQVRCDNWQADYRPVTTVLLMVEEDSHLAQTMGVLSCVVVAAVPKNGLPEHSQDNSFSQRRCRFPELEPAKYTSTR
jgi:hypothetical protein